MTLELGKKYSWRVGDHNIILLKKAYRFRQGGALRISLLLK